MAILLSKLRKLSHDRHSSGQIAEVSPDLAFLLLRADESKEYFFREGCFILELLNTPDDPALSIARARVEAGVTTANHYLVSTVERYLILEGQGEVTIDGQCEVLNAGDSVVIPASSHQSIRNTTQSDLVFLAICTPRFELENYREAQN